MKRLSKLVKKMGNNAKWLTLTEPGWCIPMPWVFYYQPIYMKAFGVTGFELGLLLTFSQLLSIFTPLADGFLIARLGMKRTYLIIDTLTNAGYLLPLILARTQTDFIAVYIFSALFAAVNPVWETLLAEGTAPEARAISYSASSIINLIGGLMTPLAGLLLTHLGIVEGYRLLAAIALAAFLLKTAVLVFKLEEPRVDGAIEEDGVGTFSALKTILYNRNLLLVSLFNIMTSITVSVLPTYMPLYLEDPRGLSLNPEEMGAIRSATSAASLLLLLYILISPYTPSLYRRLLALSASAGMAGYIAYLLATPSARGIAFLAAALLGIKSTEFTLARTFLVNSIDEVNPAMKNNVLSILSTANQALTIPVPALIGLVYTHNPRNIWILATIFSIIELTLILKLRSTQRSNNI